MFCQPNHAFVIAPNNLTRPMPSSVALFPRSTAQGRRPPLARGGLVGIGGI